MDRFKREYLLYGLKSIYQTTEEILQNLGISERPELNFDLKLIMIEAMTNAYKHGNKCDPTKPITLRVLQTDKSVRIEVQDCGSGFDNLVIPRQLMEGQFLNESGRGLFLINCYSDNVEIKENILIIDKYI